MYHRTSYELSRVGTSRRRQSIGTSSFATPRVLTYSTRDVIDNRISIPAQHSLVRLSKNPATSADAVAMLAEIKAGRLQGIYCVNWKIPAQRALLLGLSWWTAIPQGEDAVVILDPDNPVRGQPLIAFRRELDPDCGLLKGEMRFPASPARLDAALLKAWAGYQLLRTGKLTRCPRQPDGGTVAEVPLPGRSLVTPLRNLVPPILCQIGGGTGKTIVAFASGYLNPHMLTQNSEKAEIAALKAGLWEPSSEDFAATAERGSASMKIPVGGLQFLLGVLHGQSQGSIQKLILIGHSSPTTFSFSGTIGTEVIKGRRTSLVTFDPPFEAITKTTLEAPPTSSFIQRNQLWDRFAPGAEIVLFGCHSGLSQVRRRSTTPSPELLDALSKTFRVCARGFKNEICSILVLQTIRRRGRIISERISERGWVAYDPKGRLKCRNMLNRKFLRTFDQLVPDKSSSSCASLAPVLRPRSELRFGQL